MGDLDNNHFQPIVHDFARSTKVPIGIGNQASHLKNMRVSFTNTCQWTDEQQHWIVDFDTYEKSKGKNFMKRIKSKRDNEYPERIGQLKI